MAGASDAHNTIAFNVAFALRNHLQGSGYRLYISDMKADIETPSIYYYPDVMVTCDEQDRAFEYFKRYPCVIVEVLSTETEGFDRGKKFTDYRHLETLQGYVLISQDRVSVECLRRNSEGRWVLYPYSKGEEIHLASVDFRCQIASLYENVTLPFPPNSVETAQ